MASIAAGCTFFFKGCRLGQQGSAVVQIVISTTRNASSSRWGYARGVGKNVVAVAVTRHVAGPLGFERRSACALTVFAIGPHRLPVAVSFNAARSPDAGASSPSP